MTTATTEAEAIAKLAAEGLRRPYDMTAQGPSIYGAPTSVPYAVIPDGMKAIDLKPFLESFREHPERPTGTAVTMDTASFINHVNRHKTPSSVIFCNRDWKAPRQAPRNYQDAVEWLKNDTDAWTRPSLTAVLDYHHPTNADTYAGLPQWGEHRTCYTFPLSKEFLAWATFNELRMTQADMAAFFEDRAIDIVPPPTFNDSDPYSENKDFHAMLERMTNLLAGRWGDAFDAMNMSRTMRIHENSKVEQTTKRESGQDNLIYTTEHTDDQGQKFEPKSLFLLSIPIFEQGPKYLLPILVSYKLRASAITWSYKMYRHDLAVNDAIQTACAMVAAETTLPLIYGTPEMRGR